MCLILRLATKASPKVYRLMLVSILKSSWILRFPNMRKNRQNCSMRKSRQNCSMKRAANSPNIYTLSVRSVVEDLTSLKSSGATARRRTQTRARITLRKWSGELKGSLTERYWHWLSRYSTSFTQTAASMTWDRRLLRWSPMLGRWRMPIQISP